MEKDPRYDALKILIEAGYVSNFKEIFDHLPKSILGSDLSINNNRITRLIAHPDQFSVKELSTIASLIGIEPMLIIKLVFAQLDMEQSKFKQTKTKGNKKSSI
jgi:hypothetical protein